MIKKEYEARGAEYLKEVEEYFKKINNLGGYKMIITFILNIIVIVSLSALYIIRRREELKKKKKQNIIK